MKVGIFLNTTSGDDKKDYLLKFAKGIAATGDDPIIVKNRKYTDCDIALIFGFYNKNIQDSLVYTYRKKIYEKHTSLGKKCIFIDADLFRFAGDLHAKKASDPLHHLRIAYESIYISEAKHFNENSPPDRWKIIKSRKKINILDWNNGGQHILICPNSDPDFGRGWGSRGMSTTKWLHKIVKEVRSISNRPIIIRYHPNAKDDVKKRRSWKTLIKYKNIKFSGGIILPEKYSNFVIRKTSMKDDCKNAHACIAYNSSASVIAVVNGIPVFTKQKNCPVYPVANKNLKNLENPILYDINQWLYNTSYSLWNKREMEQGIPWKRIKNGIISQNIP